MNTIETIKSDLFRVSGGGGGKTVSNISSLILSLNMWLFIDVHILQYMETNLRK